VAIRLLEAAEAHELRITAGAVTEGLARPGWPARLETFALDDCRRVLLDAAHNEDGATALAEHIRRWLPEPPVLVFGVMRDKDVTAMLRILLPVVSRVIATAAPTPRAMAPADLARHAAAIASELAVSASVPIHAVTDPEEALRQALDASPLVCVAGSIFLAGAVRSSLERRTILR
jgi:dihydrofolate synthase/folylpolyglutamate synthase